MIHVRLCFERKDSTMKKVTVLVYEDRDVVPVVRDALATITSPNGETIEMVVVKDPFHGLEALPFADILVVDVEEAIGRILAPAAIFTGKPTILTSTRQVDQCAVENKRVCLIKKPEFDLHKFCSAILRFLDILSEDEKHEGRIDGLVYQLMNQRAEFN